MRERQINRMDVGRGKNIPLVFNQRKIHYRLKHPSHSLSLGRSLSPPLLLDTIPYGQAGAAKGKIPLLLKQPQWHKMILCSSQLQLVKLVQGQPKKVQKNSSLYVMCQSWSLFSVKTKCLGEQ